MLPTERGARPKMLRSREGTDPAWLFRPKTHEGPAVPGRQGGGYSTPNPDRQGFPLRRANTELQRTHT